MIRFDPARGLISFEETPFRNGRIIWTFDEGSWQSGDLRWRKTTGGAVATGDGLEFRVKTPGGRLRVSVRNRSSRPMTLRTIQVRVDPKSLPRAPQAGDYLEFIHTRNFEGNPGVKKVGLPNRQLKADAESSMLYILQEIESRQGYLFSTLPPHRGDFVTFRALHDEPHLEGTFGLLITSTQDRLLPPRAEGAMSPIQCAGGEPLALMERYGAQLAKGWKTKLKPVKIGWNSWDYYAGAVTAEDMLKNLRFARKSFPDRVKYFVIDEGWEPRWGAWVANWKFPKGLKDFCRRVRAEGGRPGVWTAPLLVNTYTTLYREKPDWFLRDKSGAVKTKLYGYGPMAYLDITVPEAERWLFDTFRRLKGEGFEYFKVDFTQETLQADLWHDRTVPRGELLRRAFGTIRRAIGAESYLLACGAPFESVLGVADAVRVSGDIHNFWSHVRTNALSVAARWWMHRRVCNVDPDFLIVRSTETSTLPRMNRAQKRIPFSTGYPDFWLAGREMNLREVKSYALLVYVSGGDIMLSDELPTLKKAGLDILKKVLERPLPDAAVPVDLFHGHDSLPSVWLAEEEGGWFLGLFNWEEDRERIELDLHSLGLPAWSRIERFWDGSAVEAEDGLLTVDLPPRGAEGIRIRRS